MLDKKGYELKIGDWVKIDPYRNSNNVIYWYGQIKNIRKDENDKYGIAAWVDARRFHPENDFIYGRNSFEIEKAADEEIMILFLEQ